MLKEKNVNSVSFIIRSTPFDDGSFEHELFITQPINLGETLNREIEQVINDEGNPLGIIILLHKKGRTIEIGSDDDPIPNQVFEQMKTKKGLLLISTDKDGEIVEVSQLNYSE